MQKQVRTKEQTAADRAKRDERAAAGFCRCGKPREAHWKLCARCREVVRAKSARRFRPDVKAALRWLERGLGDVIELQTPEIELKLRYALQALNGPDSFNDRCIKACELAESPSDARLALERLQVEEGGQ